MNTLDIAPATPWIRTQTTLCENPLWDGTSLYWCDIPSGRIHRQRWGAETAPEVFEGEAQVGGFTFQQDGSLLLFRERDIAILVPGQAPRKLLDFDHAGSTRFNDVIADPRGRVFAGTIGKGGPHGGLFRVDLDGTITQVESGTGCSNGMGFSPGNEFFYWTCSTRRRIFRYPYNEATGALGKAELFFEAGADDGVPDGMTLDRDGNLYSIRWTAKEHGLAVINPKGEIIHRHPIAARATTSAIFCGPELRDLVVTSAHQDNDPNRPADLFLISEMPTPGLPEYRSAIGC